MHYGYNIISSKIGGRGCFSQSKDYPTVIFNIISFPYMISSCMKPCFPARQHDVSAVIIAILLWYRTALMQDPENNLISVVLLPQREMQIIGPSIN